MKLLKTKWTRFLLSIPLLLASCQKEDPYNPETISEYIEFSFSLPQPTSRAQIGADGSGTFEEEDSIGIYIGNPGIYHILTLRNGKWEPQLLRKELGTGTVTINACYPAPNNEPGKESQSHLHQIVSDQQNEGFKASDILWSHQTVNMDALSGNRIELPFFHGLHRLEITLKEESGELPSDLKIAVRTATEVSFEYNSGQAQLDGENLKMEWITPSADLTRQGVFYAIVAPQSLSELQKEEGWIRITTNGKDSYYKAPTEIGGSNVLKSGKESQITLNMKKDGEVDPNPDIKWANRKVWVHGVNSPVFEEDKAPILNPGATNYQPGQWFIIQFNWGDHITYEYKLPWIEGCGWYDCNKTYSWDNAPDRNLCWAASSSNVLHWWMEHNASYIEAYDKAYSNTEYYKKYPRPDTTFRPHPFKSEIFKLFTYTFNNRGAGEGVHWFINGTAGYGTSGIIDPSMLDFKGYFKEVFSNIDGKIYMDERAMSKQRFNEILKDALENKKAITFATYTSLGNHDMTIWGAEFDEQGYASYLYYTDNNPQGDPDPAGAACIRMEISYRKYDIMGLEDQTYMGDTPITALGIVDLRQDVWKKAFPKVDVSPKN